jgi:hypothetical protein
MIIISPCEEKWGTKMVSIMETNVSYLSLYAILGCQKTTKVCKISKNKITTETYEQSRTESIVLRAVGK